jgi:hypothetical protein
MYPIGTNPIEALAIDLEIKSTQILLEWQYGLIKMGPFLKNSFYEPNDCRLSE